MRHFIILWYLMPGRFLPLQKAVFPSFGKSLTMLVLFPCLSELISTVVSQMSPRKPVEIAEAVFFLRNARKPFSGPTISVKVMKQWP